MLLSQDQRFQIANRLIDIMQTLLFKDAATAMPAPAPAPIIPAKDDFDSMEFDRNIEEEALSFLDIIEDKPNG